MKLKKITSAVLAASMVATLFASNSALVANAAVKEAKGAQYSVGDTVYVGPVVGAVKINKKSAAKMSSKTRVTKLSSYRNTYYTKAGFSDSDAYQTNSDYNQNYRFTKGQTLSDYNVTFLKKGTYKLTYKTSEYQKSERVNVGFYGGDAYSAFNATTDSYNFDNGQSDELYFVYTQDAVTGEYTSVAIKGYSSESDYNNRVVTTVTDTASGVSTYSYDTLKSVDITAALGTYLVDSRKWNQTNPLPAIDKNNDGFTTIEEAQNYYNSYVATLKKAGAVKATATTEKVDVTSVKLPANSKEEDSWVYANRDILGSNGRINVWFTSVDVDSDFAENNESEITVTATPNAADPSIDDYTYSFSGTPVDDADGDPSTITLYNEVSYLVAGTTKYAYDSRIGDYNKISLAKGYDGFTHIKFNAPKRVTVSHTDTYAVSDKTSFDKTRGISSVKLGSKGKYEKSYTSTATSWKFVSKEAPKLSGKKGKLAIKTADKNTQIASVIVRTYDAQGNPVYSLLKSNVKKNSFSKKITFGNYAQDSLDLATAQKVDVRSINPYGNIESGNDFLTPVADPTDPTGTTQLDVDPTRVNSQSGMWRYVDTNGQFWDVYRTKSLPTTAGTATTRVNSVLRIMNVATGVSYSYGDFVAQVVPYDTTYCTTNKGGFKTTEVFVTTTDKKSKSSTVVNSITKDPITGEAIFNCTRKYVVNGKKVTDNFETRDIAVVNAEQYYFYK